MTIRVLLADDHAIMLAGLRLLVDTQPDIKAVGEAADGREAVRLAQLLRPDVVVMDMAMPAMNGIEATHQIREANPSTRVIILSMYSTTEHLFQALRAGALGYVLKQAAGTELLDGIRAVYAGRRYVSKKLAGTLPAQESSQIQSPLERLTTRELQVLQLTVEGKSASEIAAVLSLSRRSVITYRSRLMDKLSLDDLPGLVRFAIQHGLTPPT